MQINTTKVVNDKANMIWEVATKLVGVFKPHEYGKVLLPMTILKRLNDVLKPTKEEVLNKFENEYKSFGSNRDLLLKEITGFDFYNVSKYDFEKLLSDPDNIESNFKDFYNGFSDNVIDIMKNFDFENIVEKLADNNRLYAVIEEMNTKKADMSLNTITSVEMGYIFEELIRKFSESYDEEAGAHFTSRDIIYLMTDLLINYDKELLTKEGISKEVYDMTMGTSQMLACMEERIKDYNKDAEVICYGQELNQETYAIAKADMLIKGGDTDNLKLGDTLSNDQFKDYTFDYIISNPPFGIDWKSEKKSVEDEYALGDKGRFAPGLPKISDGQMLFTLNGMKKLKKNSGRMAIIQNGSPLFSGTAGGGESNIRKYIIENDRLEAIIQLPTDSFYNTPIATYIWIITGENGKEEKRKGKVQLIDASKMCTNRRKNIGNKKVDISEDDRKNIVKVYNDFLNKEYDFDSKNCESKIFDNDDFGYNKIVVESPEYDEDGKVIVDKKGNKKPDSSKRDYENVPLKENIEEYLEKEILQYNKDAWIDEKKTQVGYEITFTKYFYKYEAPEKSEVILSRIKNNESSIMDSLNKLFKEDINE